MFHHHAKILERRSLCTEHDQFVFLFGSGPDLSLGFIIAPKIAEVPLCWDLLREDFFGDNNASYLYGYGENTSGSYGYGQNTSGSYGYGQNTSGSYGYGQNTSGSYGYGQNTGSYGYGQNTSNASYGGSGGYGPYGYGNKSFLKRSWPIWHWQKGTESNRFVGGSVALPF